MSYTKDFNHILNMQARIANTNLFILKNDKPSDIKVFPEEIKTAILAHYFDTLRGIMKENEFVSYIPDKQSTGTLQVIAADKLPLWTGMLGARQSLPAENQPEIMVTDYTCSGNTLLMDIEFQDGSRAYFLSVYRNVTAWYSNRVRFTKGEEGKFHEEKGNILALTPFVDAVIFQKQCYIINESNFNSIFKFDEVIKNQIKEHEAEIRGLDFIENADQFMTFLGHSKRQRAAMAKVIMQNRLEKIKKYTPGHIRKQIERRPELSFFKYAEDDKILIDDKKSFSTIVGILCGTINLDLITNELNGMDEYE